MKEIVAAVVVTYNRKELLIKCLSSLRKQTRLPDTIYIIDNQSTDGTPQYLIEHNYIPNLPRNNRIENQTIEYQVQSLIELSDVISIKYIRKFENDGGAGGFYEGMKQAFEDENDWIWMMDDDGIADCKQLEKLLFFSKRNKIDCANALVIDINNISRLAFGIRNHFMVDEIEEKEIIFDESNPFNGTMISHQVPKRIGFIKKEMFIWGDETEYVLRIKRNNFRIATIIDAIHYHPQSKTIFYPVFPFWNIAKVELKPQNRSAIFFRNKGYIYKQYYGKKDVVIFFSKYIIYYIFRLEFKKLKIFITSFHKGFKNNFLVI